MLIVLYSERYRVTLDRFRACALQHASCFAGDVHFDELCVRNRRGFHGNQCSVVRDLCAEGLQGPPCFGRNCRWMNSLGVHQVS